MSVHRRLLQFLSSMLILSMLLSAVPLPSASAQGSDGLKRQFNAQTGKVSFIGPENGRALSASRALGTFIRPQNPAMALARQFGSEFGLKNPERELAEMAAKRPGDGRLTVRYQQSYQEIPVLGGELIVNTSDSGDLYSINGEISPDISLSTRPAIDAEQAKQTALQGVVKWYQGAPEDFLASEPELWIFDENLLRPSTRAPELVWRLEVTPQAIGVPVRELVLVNAHRGHISLHFNQVDAAWGEVEKERSSPVLDAPGSTTDLPSLAGVTWYVATTGSDANSCNSPGSPCATINGAIAKAAAGDTLYIAVGTYTSPTTVYVANITKDLMLSGGWNASFTAQTGASIIDGQNRQKGVLVYYGGTTVTATLERFAIINGNANGTEGGGIWNVGVLTLNNVTLGNNVAFTGGGIHNNQGATLLLNNVTISSNTGGHGGGIYNENGTVIAKNSLIADNSTIGNGPDCFGPINASSYSLIGNTSSCQVSSQQENLLNVSPRLSLFSESGGYFPLMMNSPAIDAGNPATPGSGGNACLATDQRGVTRPVGTRCDIGAFEGSVAWTLPILISTYSAGNSTSLPGTFICNQADPNCAAGDAHAKAAHRYAIGTYQMFASQYGRNSLDNNGMPIVSTVHYSSGYANAFWDGSQVVYGNAYGYPLADDIVAHELTHGVTEHESNLFYYYQSGAINESFSDLWGEYYDQTNVQVTDTSGVKWQLGEDVSGLGAIRSMSSPTSFGDPDKMTSIHYYMGADDSGGVHSNSGVNNKAVFLMVDGGSFNGKTVTALGWEKTAAIYYEANTNLLSSGADYSDLYYALQQACSNLIGQRGITSANCTEVKDALDAVEMNAQPTPGFNTDAPYCDQGSPVSTVFSDGMESGTGNWTFNNGAYSRWQLDSPYAPYAHSGQHSLYADDDPGLVTDASAQLRSLVIPGSAYLRFAHAYDFESSNQHYDGGVLEYSLNGGSSWIDAGSLMDHNGYRGTIFTGANNPLSGRSAFVGASHGYISTRVNLASLAGNSVIFRWRMGLDEAASAWGWWLDDVEIYQCTDSTAPVVSSILRASGNPSSASKVYFSVTFSEPVIGVGVSDFTLTTGGSISGTAIETVGGSGSSYVVAVNTGTGGGTLRLNVPGTASITDLAGNAIAGLPFTSGETYTMNSGERSSDVILNRMGDFNADGKSDMAVFRPSDGFWYISTLGNFQYGEDGDIPVPGDYNGDGRDDIAVFRPSNGFWYISTLGNFQYGENGDIPVPGDYNGDGKDDVAVYRPSTGTWYILSHGNFIYGQAGDIPLPADYDGDGRDDIAVFRPSNGTWYISTRGNYLFGQGGDVPVTGDYNGDGRAEMVVYRPSNGTWYIHSIGSFLFGTVGDIPVVGDFDGDGKENIAVFRPSNGTWYIYGIGSFLYGTVGDIPI